MATEKGIMRLCLFYTLAIIFDQVSFGMATPRTVGPVKEDLPRCQSVNTDEVKTWTKAKGQSVYFLTRNGTIVVAQAGSKAILPCTVRNLCDGTISWIRRKDYNLLTVGAATYAGDERFQTVHTYSTNSSIGTTSMPIVDPALFSTIPSKDWSLQIKFVQLRDAGYYECQVTSHPPFSIIVMLKVVEARVEISGAPEKYVKVGSSLELKCTLLNSPSVPEFVFWYHNDRMVNYDIEHGMNITTDLINKQSFLEIRKANRDHTGNYTCVASNAYPDSTMVHVLNGKNENPAAMQTGADIRISASSFLFATSFVLVILLSKYG